MPERLRDYGPRSPQPRVSPKEDVRGYFFPGEVAALLDCRDIDYRQLRALFKIVRAQAGDQAPRQRGWSRYTLADVAALRTLLDLCGGPGAVVPGKRLRVAVVEEALMRLRDMGFDNPLLEANIRWEGRRLVAEASGRLFDADTGQTRLSDEFGRLSAFVEHEVKPRGVVVQMRQESRARRVRPSVAPRPATVVLYAPGHQTG